MRIRRMYFRGLVLIDQLLNGRLLVASGPDQVFVSIFQIVLVESELGLGDAELFLKSILLTITGLRQLLSQLGHAGLVRRDACFHLFDSRKKAACLGRQWRGIFRRVVHRRRERQVNGMVTKPQSLLREVLLVVRDREWSELLSGLERVHID